MIRFIRQENGTYLREGELPYHARVTVHSEGINLPDTYTLAEAEESFFKHWRTGQFMSKPWYELRPVKGTDKQQKEEELPVIPAEPKPLVFQLVANVPSVVLDDGTYSIAMFLDEGGDRQLVEELRKRPDVNFYAAIIAQQGIQVVDGLTAEKAFPLALALVRYWWKNLITENSVDIDVPIEKITLEARQVYKVYLQTHKVRIKNAQKQAQAQPGVKVGKQPRLPKDITFAVAKPGDSLKGEYKQIYDTVVAMGGTAQVDAMTKEAFKRGFVGRGKNPEYGPRWLALQIVKQGVLYVVGTQSVIPGTPEPLPRG